MVVERALIVAGAEEAFLKRYAADVKLTPEELTTIRQETVAAIDAANPVVGRLLRKDLDAGWGQ